MSDLVALCWWLLLVFLCAWACQSNTRQVDVCSDTRQVAHDVVRRRHEVQSQTSRTIPQFTLARIRTPPIHQDSASSSSSASGCTNGILVSRGEVECARVMQLLFPSHTFIKVRPTWLLNDYPGRKTPAQPLELDLYCERLCLAVEYNGPQHYRVTPDFHPHGEKSLYGQTCRDRLKADKCRERGIDLIVVNSLEVVHSDICGFLATHPGIRSRRE